MTISQNECRALLEDHYNAVTRKRLAHTERVLALCRAILGELPPAERERIDAGLLDAAATLHDIAKPDDKENHHKKALKIILRARQEQALKAGSPAPEPGAGPFFLALGEVIRHHKGKFKPEPPCAREAAILRTADKIDMLHQGWEESEIKYRDTLSKIHEYCQKHSLEPFYRALKAAAEKVKIPRDG